MVPIKMLLSNWGLLFLGRFSTPFLWSKSCFFFQHGPSPCRSRPYSPRDVPRADFGRPLRRGWRVPCPRRSGLQRQGTKTTNWLDLGPLGTSVLFQLGWQRWIWNICGAFQVCLQNNMNQLGANHGRSGYIRHSRDDRYGKGKGRKIIKRWIPLDLGWVESTVDITDIF